MKTNSIRLRVLAVAIASIVVTIAVAGGALVFLFERQVLRYVEQNLNLHWTELAAAFELDPNGDPGLAQRLTDPRYQQPYGGAYWQVSEGGRPILRSRSLFDKELPPASAPQNADIQNAYEAEGPDGAELYVVAQTSRLTAVPARAFSIWRSRWITSRSLNCGKRSGGTSHASWFPSRRSWCFSHGSRSGSASVRCERWDIN